MTGTAGAALFARPGFDGQPGFGGVFPATGGQGREIVDHDEVHTLQMVCQAEAMGVLGEIELIAFQVHGEEAEIFFRCGRRERGAGGLQVLDGHFAVDEQDAARHGGVPAEECGAGGDGMGDGQGKPRLADAAGAVDEGEGGVRQPGGEEKVAFGQREAAEVGEGDGFEDGIGDGA